MDKFCANCGAKLGDGDKVCGYCGTPISNLKLSVKTKPIKSKRRIKFFLLGGIVIVWVIATVISFFGSRYLSVLKRYCEAIESADGEKMLSIYDPDWINSEAAIYDIDEEEINAAMEEKARHLYEMMSEDCGEKFKASYGIVGIIKDDNSYMITLQFQGKGKEGEYYGKLQLVKIYKSNGRWYMFIDGDSPFEGYSFSESGTENNEEQKKGESAGIWTEDISDSGISTDVEENIADDVDVTEESFDWSTLSVASEEDFEWKEVNESAVSITGYLGSEADLKVPGTIDGKTVVRISEYAFSEQEGLVSIDLTDTSLRDIGQQAFSECPNLKRVALPDMSTYSIDTNPFLHCGSLSEIVLGEGSELEMENGMIYSDTKLILRIPAFADVDVVIREGTTEISHAAFLDNNVVSVVMPDSVVFVDRLIFEGCTKLESITLSSNLKYISQYMFEFCISLKEITIPEGVEEIISSAFMWCNSLMSVSLPSTLTKIDDYAFCRCEALTNISIPASVTRIGDKAFASGSLTDVYYGGSEQDWHSALGTDVFESAENDAAVNNITIHYNNE